MYTPVDTKRNAHYGSNYWEVYSPKIKRIVSLYSDLEYDNWILIEANPNVKMFCEQPLRIKWLYEGNIAESILDMWVQYHDGTEEFIEVKYSKELNPDNPKSKRSLKQVSVQKEWCEANGHAYRVNTEIEIRSNYMYLSNIKKIFYFIKGQEHGVETDLQRVLKSVSAEKTTIKCILDKMSNIPINRALEAIYLLIFKQILNSDINRKILSHKTEVWINE